MKVLLIGGGGYLGIPLSKELIKRGHEVIIYDSFKYKTEDLIECKKILGDVRSITFRTDFHYSSFDAIFYMAQPRLGELQSEYEVKDSVQGFKTFIESFNWEGTTFTPKIYFISSCSVYGVTDKVVDEKSPTIVTSLYSQMKIFCENILCESQIPSAKILRLSTLYGDNQYVRNDVFINNILNDIILGVEIKIFDSTANRPHLHVNDCAEILSQLVEKKIEERIINIGFNELNKSKIEICQIIKKFIDFNLVQYETKDSRNYSVDFTNLLKYIENKYISYEDGIKNYLNNRKNTLN